MEATDGSGYSRNGLKFKVADDAKSYAVGLAQRWFALRGYRVVDTRDDSIIEEVRM